MRKAKRFTETSAKLEFIEGIRALAALYVVVSHFCSMVIPPDSARFNQTKGTFLANAMGAFRNGHLAVAAFIVLSGFCLQYGLFQRGDGRVYGLGGFFKRRAFRILPAYYATLALSVAVCYWVTWPNRELRPFDTYVKASSGLPVTLDSLLAHIFLLQNLSMDWMYRINGALWSISIEAQLYLLFPWLILVMQKRSPVALLVVTAIPSLLIAAFVPGAAKMYSWFAILFVAGMMAAHYAHRPDPVKGLKPAYGFAVFWSGLLATFYMVYQQAVVGKSLDSTTLIASDLTCGFATAAFLYSATISPGGLAQRALSARWLVRIGVASYSLYLIHHPLLQMLYVYRPAWASNPESETTYLVTLALPVIVVASLIFSWIFERPFVKSYLPAFHDEPSNQTYQLPLRPLAQATVVSYAYLEGENKEAPHNRGASKRRGKAKLY